MDTNLGKIKNVVVLMLENRSLDWMAGWLYAPSNVSPNGDPYDGLTGSEWCPDTSGNKVFVSRGTDLTAPLPDPGERFDHITYQISAGSPDGAMKGFVLDYASVIEEYNDDHIIKSDTDPAIMMQCFGPESLPVLSALARNYAICDCWFCSVPSQTWPNRSFLHAGTSSGMVNNKQARALFSTPNNTRTVFNVLQDANVTWAIYWDHEDVVGPLAWLSQDQLAGLEDHFFDMDQFLDDAANGNLPSYTFIEPRFLLDHNDQHPGSWFIPPIFADKVSNGEALISQVYQAVRNSPQWNETMLVVTYDEHGGCYDHVQPPTNAVPPNGPGQEGFDFTRFGVRVPTLVISPYTQVGQVFRPPTGQTFDHTSILKTVMELLIPGYNPETDSLTPRDRAAPDLSPALQLPDNPGGGLTNPRTDFPGIPDTSELVEATVDPLALEVPLTDFQKSIVLAAMRRKMGEAALLAATPPLVETVGDALAYLRTL